MKISILIIFFVLYCSENKSDKQNVILSEEKSSQHNEVYSNFIVTAKSGLVLREIPDASSQAILTIPWNSIVHKIEDTNLFFITENVEGKWFKVVYNFSIGYVFSGFLKEDTTSKSNIEYLFIDSKPEVQFEYDKKEERNATLEFGSYRFTFPPKINSKVYFYPFSNKIKKPIKLNVSFVEFQYFDDSGDSTFRKGFLEASEGLYGRFRVNFDKINDRDYINDLILQGLFYPYGIIIYPKVDKFVCLKKENIINLDLPDNLNSLEFAIDINGDLKPDILRYRIVTGISDTRKIWTKNKSEQWTVYEEYSSKNYDYEVEEDGLYHPQYLCN
ncbi:SH3 domain-containing protein [Leptospira sp. GIMC2001]|uniref:SH3 domain-containing protein n=1 Tax=Leptospira sp. GIMC2001 TaxID=1513297 RepID=UPI00234A8072|nr:SH3 domain-containing protein [Leptospira sp. GIMC2001]WCL50808.1 SH3 domain-containing protein [Leptospira sp. GIMC2001]